MLLSYSVRPLDASVCIVDGLAPTASRSLVVVGGYKLDIGEVSPLASVLIATVGDASVLSAA